MGNAIEDSDGNLLQRIETVLNACKIELAFHVFPLLIKPTGLHNLFLAEEDVRCVFSENFGKGVMLPGPEILAVETGCYHHFQSVVYVYLDAKRKLHW